MRRAGGGGTHGVGRPDAVLVVEGRAPHHAGNEGGPGDANEEANEAVDRNENQPMKGQHERRAPNAH